MVNVISTDIGATVTTDRSLAEKVEIPLKEIPYVMEELAKRIIRGTKECSHPMKKSSWISHLLKRQ